MIIQGDCIEEMKKLEENSVDAAVTDPPYELGFMGKSWDKSGIAYNKDMWAECLRVLKPGGHLLSFGGSRTYHRMACAIEDAGFEIRDQIMWVYGSGFPKSLNIGKAVDKSQGNEREETPNPRHGGGTNNVYGKGMGDGNVKPKTKGTSEWEGWGTALKPAHEPIVLARKPLSEKTVAENVLKWGTGGLNIDASRVSHNEPIKKMKAQEGGNKVYGQSGRYEETTELKASGRFPANLIHDGSDEVVGMFPETKTGAVKNETNNHGKFYGGGYTPERPANSGSAARFFYTAKASKAERNRGLEGMEKVKVKITEGHGRGDINTSKKSDGGIRAIIPSANHHPTVKPISLMKYLIKLVTPPKGIILDPFLGSGSTAVAAKELGYECIGIDREEEYCEIARKRVEAVQKPFV